MKNLVFYSISLLWFCISVDESVTIRHVSIGNKFELMKTYGTEFEIKVFGGKKNEIIDSILAEEGEISKIDLLDEFHFISKEDFIIGIKLNASKDISEALNSHKFLIDKVTYSSSLILKKKLFLLDNGTIVEEYLNEKENTPFSRRRNPTNKMNLVKKEIFQYNFLIGIKPKALKNNQIEFKNLTKERIVIVINPIMNDKEDTRNYIQKL